MGWSGGEYQYPLSNRFRLRVGADLIHTDYAGKRFDRTFALMHLGPRFLVDRDTEISLLAAGRRRWLAGSAWSYDLGTRVEVERRLGPPAHGLRAGPPGISADTAAATLRWMARSSPAR